jgi:hypothetical protein
MLLHIHAVPRGWNNLLDESFFFYEPNFLYRSKGRNREYEDLGGQMLESLPLGVVNHTWEIYFIYFFVVGEEVKIEKSRWSHL